MVSFIVRSRTSKTREAVVLHHLSGLWLGEMAGQLSRSEGAVSGLLHSGIKRLRERLRDRE